MTSYPIKLLTTTAVPVAPVGFRSVRLGWKTKRDGTAPLSPNKYVHVAVDNTGLFEPDLVQSAKDYLSQLFNDAQDKLIHTIVSKSIEDGQPIDSIRDEQINLFALVADNAATSRGTGKISGDMVVEWFASELHDSLAIWVMQQKPDAVDDDVKKMVANYEQFYKKFASPAFGIQSIVAQKLMDVLQLSEGKQHPVYMMLEKRLSGMVKEKTAEDYGL